MTVRSVIACLAAGAVASCASIVGDTESTVQVRTNPEGAICTVSGQGGFSATITAPGAVTIPHTESPVTVTCASTGYRPSVNTLSASADGWVWGNGALILGTAGVMVLGAIIDESRGAGKSYAEDVEYTLQPDRPRVLNARDRRGGEWNLLAR